MSLLNRLALPTRLLPVAVVAVLATSACQPATSGAAAIIGNDRLAVSQLQHDVEALVADGGGAGQQPGDLARSTVDRWIYSQLVDRVAAEHGVSVTDGEVSARIAQVKAQTGEDGYREAVLSSGVPLEDADALVRMVVQIEAIGEALVPDSSSADQQALAQQRQQAIGATVIKAAQDAEIEVNPRYGEFDVDTLTVRGLPSGGLASGKKTPTPAP